LDNRVGVNATNAVLGHHVLNSVLGVTCHLKSIGRVLTGLVDKYDGTSWVLVRVVGHVVYFVVNYYPHVTIGVMLAHLLPAIHTIGHQLTKNIILEVILVKEYIR